ncbi:MAG TPA: LysR family transcriptional regulator [Gaiellaceae bacterium]|nr:LysR family transcriptional regulator [Gaiellaceae bacterium]
MAITLTQLRTFLAVARTGAVHAAARQLYVSQPSVSAALAALEREVGADLVERHGRGIRLTQAGEAFAPYAAKILGLVSAGQRAALETVRPEASRVRIVAVSTAGEFVLPPLIQAHRALRPEVEVLLEVANRKTVLERLESWSADIGVGGRPQGADVVGRAFLDNRLVVVGREVPRSLDDAVWLLREEGSGTRAATEAFLAERRIEPRDVLTLGSNGAIKQALLLGLGITLVSDWAVARELADGRLVQIPARGTPLVRPWYALRPRGPSPRPAVRDFLAFLHSEAARQVAQRTIS